MSEKTQDIAALYDQYLMRSYAPAVALLEGHGSRVTDLDNMQYIDLTAGIATLACGHCHPKVTEAIVAQAKLLPHGSNLYYNHNMVLLAQRLSKLSGGYKAFFANSGAEANENMVKIARLWGKDKGGRYEVITFNKGFHGRTLAMCAATAQAKAFAMISSYRVSRRLTVSFLESSRPGNDVSRGSTTAAAYTGPARGPAPASSQPQIH